LVLQHDRVVPSKKQRAQAAVRKGSEMRTDTLQALNQLMTKAEEEALELWW
jgi:hypothetical protein